jgi:hypothetical protein
MTGSLLAQWVIPIVVAFALFSWLFAVLHANAHPQYKHHSRLPRYEVTGGAFEANDGGRQLMPIHGGRPLADRPGHEDSAASAGIPAQRSASSTASASAPGAGAGQGTAAGQGTGAARAAAGQPGVPRQRRLAEPGQRVSEERHLAEGSKLR